MTDVLEELLNDAELDAALREQLEAVDEESFDLALSKVDEGLADLDEVPAPEALLARTMARIDAEQKPQPGLFGTLVLGLGSGLGGLASGVASLGRPLARAFRAPSRTAWIAMSASAAGALLVCGVLFQVQGANQDSVASIDGLNGDDDQAFIQSGPPASQIAEQAAQNGAVASTLPSAGEPNDDGYFGGGLNVPSYRERGDNGDGDFRWDGDTGGRVDLAQNVDDLSDRAIGGDDGIVDTPARVASRDSARYAIEGEQTGDGWGGQGQRGERTRQRGPEQDDTTGAGNRRSNALMDGNDRSAFADELTELGNLEDGRFAAVLDEADEEEEPETAPAQVEGLFESTLAPGGSESRVRAAAVVADESIEAHFLAERDAVEGLQFQPARGIWANTYVPGDPAWRLLGRRLRGASSAGFSESPLALAEGVQPLAQRIAAPRSGALTLAAQADRASVEGRSRVLLQVALRGAAVRAGRRPTLRSMVVLDLRRPLDDDAQAQVRALLSSLSRARTGADRIGLIVAGPQGGVVLEPGQLRLGQVTVALRQVFRGEHTGRSTSLQDALATAVERVGQLSDADSPLGSGLVWLVTPGVSQSDARTLEPAAHAGSLAGVTTTTVGLGGADLDALETVALAGQGRRWLFGDDADELVRGEVQAVSRVVARAVRLNVRLAPGVKLVDVLGSRPLAEVEARRVREAERSLDQQLARRLGILSDREEDDDGVQIVVPAFYADDTHVLLFDLVVDGPGPIADVTAKYKDLLRLTNGEATERVTLGRGRTERGPREREVLRNLLAHQLSVALRRAAREVRSDRAAAAATIREARARIVAARRQLGALASDRDLAAQLDSCRAFEAALSAGAPAPLLADSLRYASRRLLFGDPLEVDP